MQKKELLLTAGTTAVVLGGLSVFLFQSVSQSYTITSPDQVALLFPKTVSELQQLAAQAMTNAKQDLQALLAIPAHERTFDNTAKALDAISGNFSIVGSIISTLLNVSTDESMRENARQLLVTLKHFEVDTFSLNKELYKAFEAYAQGNALQETLTPEQKLFIDETMKSFKRSGFGLPEDQQEKIRALTKELSELSVTFDHAINTDQKTLVVSKQELAGLEQDFIDQLQKNEEGNYILGTDYPTYFTVMEHCSYAPTRKAFYRLFNNRAYPQNDQVLRTTITKRDELAKILGYSAYAHYDFDNLMAKSPERVEEFLQEIIKKAHKKEQQEFERLIKDLPESVSLSSTGKFYPWDKAFSATYYKKKYFNIDEREIAHYFPMENTVKGLLEIYESFFGLSMKEIKNGSFWHEDVRMIEVRKKISDEIVGYLLLDLFPRPFKYPHACEITIIPALMQGDKKHIAVAVVLANFPKPSAQKPSLLELHDVRTFFHEFGHAIHTLLGATGLRFFSGTNVKTDFVEMPSQMLEEWLWDAAILKLLSSHYQTGEKLPDEKIAAIVSVKNLNSGGMVVRQAFLAELSLRYFGVGAQKDTNAIKEALFKEIISNTEYDPQEHMQASFGHLMGYGAHYYSYLWSKVFALDLFDYIKTFGLLNPVIGQKYEEMILKPGGSKDPNLLLEDFLGRKPTSDAFFKDLGLQD